MITTKDSSLKAKWDVSSNTSDFTLQSIVDQIKEGNKGNGGINLKPFYQRDYKFTRKDESLLMESLLGGIPIPVIYMASDTSKIPHVTNVIDGQHRLMAVFRFLDNKFKLTGLQKYEELNDLHFRDLHPTIQNKLKYQISLTFQLIHTQDDPELEIEIFTRYNQGTNPLTRQEIRHVVYGSLFNDWLVELVTKLKINEVSSAIFNINKKRFGDKAIHQELYVMFGIFNNFLNPNYSYLERERLAKSKGKTINKYIIQSGINQDFFSSPEYVDELMRYARGCNEEESIHLIKKCEEFIYSFIKFLKDVFIDQGIGFPLSKEIYGPVKTRNHKMQTSILMIMSAVFYNISKSDVDYHEVEIQKILKDKIALGFQNSDFPEVTTSTTERTLLSGTIEKILTEVKM
jgi:hypothetical protein